jgi:transcriptional regulator with XRE-family HTH domain
LHKVKKKLLKNPKVRAGYGRMGPEFTLIRTMIEARTKAGLSQEGLAECMGTAQSTVARLESGKQLSSLRTLYRYAEATCTRPVIKLVK